ncbi:MAG: hypothetical protein IID05_10950 [Gemmatimonadetes bacterium]|nr:hypothetical protein [Gemmatimonadota bacterium]
MRLRVALCALLATLVLAHAEQVRAVQAGDPALRGAADSAGWRMPPMDPTMPMLPGLIGAVPPVGAFMPGQGVDLHRFCRHVIHHDLDWNPSSIEQRTGRVDRLGCKAEHRNSILVYLPYLSGTADERQYRVMTDRESWFRIVMGQEEVERLIPADGEGNQLTPPGHFQQDLVFDLSMV